MKKTSKND